MDLLVRLHPHIKLQHNIMNIVSWVPFPLPCL